MRGRVAVERIDDAPRARYDRRMCVPLKVVVAWVLLFFGVQSAWFLLVEPTNEERRARAKARDEDHETGPTEGI